MGIWRIIFIKKVIRPSRLVGNIAGTLTTTFIDPNASIKQIDWANTLANATFAGGLNIGVGLFSSIGGIVGESVRATTDIATKISEGMFAGIIAGSTEALYDAVTFIFSIFVP